MKREMDLSNMKGQVRGGRRSVPAHSRSRPIGRMDDPTPNQAVLTLTASTTPASQGEKRSASRCDSASRGSGIRPSYATNPKTHPLGVYRRACALGLQCSLAGDNLTEKRVIQGEESVHCRWKAALLLLRLHGTGKARIQPKKKRLPLFMRQPLPKRTLFAFPSRVPN